MKIILPIKESVEGFQEGDISHDRVAIEFSLEENKVLNGIDVQVVNF
jgi:hypothetical protein